MWNEHTCAAGVDKSFRPLSTASLIAANHNGDCLALKASFLGFPNPWNALGLSCFATGYSIKQWIPRGLFRGSLLASKVIFWLRVARRGVWVGWRDWLK